MAYLIDEVGVNPYNILAITFTNKAAGEMRERVDKIVGFGSEQIFVSTFHSMCVRILRRHIDLLGYDTNFAIYDTDDQKQVIKEVCKKLEIDTKKIKERAIQSKISNCKDELNYARDKNKPILLIYMDEVSLPAGMEDLITPLAGALSLPPDGVIEASADGTVRVRANGGEYVVTLRDGAPFEISFSGQREFTLKDIVTE